ncbi:metallophosphoesterase [Halovenus halobia]|uniref:metallophosphoesterase n=1 Tax=Halovenus halobia TaxID=3396622 RepID=UPI003F55F2FD
MSVEPIPDERAAVAHTGEQTLLLIADYHAGIESVLRVEGVELDSQADQRRDRVLDLLAETDADRLVIIGDLLHAVGEPWDSERDELRDLFAALAVPVTLVKGNHDGDIEGFIEDIDHQITVTDSQGTRIGPIGFVHGHTWPAPDVLDAEIVCQGHEHPVVRLEDSVGGSRMEPAWLRGQLAPEAFAEAVPDATPDGDLVVFPAFNHRSGGTWINVEGQEFLSPFLPDGLADGEAYLLDGTRLGPYRSV